MASTKTGTILRWLLHLPVYLYRLGLGWLAGKRFLLLRHTGRKTSIRHETVLEVMEYRSEGPEMVVMSGFGRNAGWLRNIEANPAVEIILGRRRFFATYRFLCDEEAILVIEGYERRNRLMAPVVRWVLGRLLGWRYSGSDSDHKRLVEQLPLIAFRPRSS